MIAVGAIVCVLVFAPIAAPTPAIEPPPALRGTASWYGTGPGRGHAAASRRLRRWLGRDWRGQWVVVRHAGHRVRVRLTDTCGCPNHRLIDLSDEDFGRLAPLSKGVIHVRIRHR